MKNNVNAKVEQLLIDKTRILARREGLSYSQAVALALYDKIKEYEQKNGAITIEKENSAL